MDTSSVTGRPVPLSVVLLVCLLLVTTAFVMTMGSLALAGDGSFYLVRILDTEEVFSPDSRILGNAIRQAPVLIAVHLGLEDTHLLSALLGIGQLVLPAAIWSAALVLSRASSLAFSAVAMTAGLCAGTTWFFNVAEVVLATPLTVLVVVLLWRPQEWGWRHAVLAIAASSILVASYESVVVTGPILAVWAAWRAARSRSSIDRLGVSIVAVVTSLSVVAGFAGIVFAREPSHARSLLYFVVSGEPWQLYIGLAAIAVLVAAMASHLDPTLRSILLGAGLACAAVAIYTLVPTSQEAFAARGGAAIAALALQLFLFWLWIRDRAPSSATAHARWATRVEPAQTQWLLLVPVLFVAAMAYVDISAVGGWTRSLSAFQAEVDRAKGPTQVDEVLPEDRRHVVWGWTSSSLSLIVRHSAEAGILVDRNPSIVPFPPYTAREQLADKYTWRT
jgi:hypothetical protein